MCKFFSFITYKGQKFYFDAEQRKGLSLKEQDSHSAIVKNVFPNATVDMDTQVNKYEFDPVTGKLTAGRIEDQEELFEDVLYWVKEFAGSKKFQLILKQMSITLELALKDPSDCVRRVAAFNCNMDCQLLEIALNDTNFEVREAAASNCNMTVELLEIALKDVSSYVRMKAASNCNMTAELLELALKDPSDWVRRVAASNCNMTVELLEIALKDPNYWVRKAVASNCNMTAQLLEIALKDAIYYVRKAAELSFSEKFGRN